MRRRAILLRRLPSQQCQRKLWIPRSFPSVGEWLSLVEHLVRDQGVGGSNPLSPTNPYQFLNYYFLCRWWNQEHSRNRFYLDTVESLPDLAIAETVHQVIVHHPDRLHVGVDDRRTNETESALFEVLAEGIGFG